MSESTGQLLRKSRSDAKLDLRDVAERAEVPVEVLEAFEDGRGRISTAKLERVAYVLAIDPIALRQGRIEKRPTATVFFRQGAFPDFRDDEDRPKVASALERAGALLDINALLGRPPSLRPRLQPEPDRPEAAKDGYRLANRVRAELGNEMDPLPDAAELLEERFEILVLAERLATSSIHALSVKDNVRGAASVIVNVTGDRWRNPNAVRVDLLHELGHVLFDPANEDVNLVVDTGGEGRTPRLEQRANAFAAEMLMPAEALRRLLGKPTYEMSPDRALELVSRVRQELVTPIEITVNHLVNREYLVDFIREAVIDEARKRELGRPEPAIPSLGQRPDVLSRRVAEAIERDLITRERAREMLGLNPWDDTPVDW